MLESDGYLRSASTVFQMANIEATLLGELDRANVPIDLLQRLADVFKSAAERNTTPSILQGDAQSEARTTAAYYMRASESTHSDIQSAEEELAAVSGERMIRFDGYARKKTKDFLYWYQCSFVKCRGYNKCRYKGQIIKSSDGQYVVMRSSAPHQEHQRRY